VRRCLLLLMLAVVSVLALPATAEAHPLGNFTINRYSLIQLDHGTARVTFALDIAEIPTFQALGEQPTQADADRYLAAHADGWARSLHLTVNGRVVPLVPDAAGGDTGLRPGQGGLKILRVELPLTGALTTAGSFRATYRDDSFGDRLGWKEIVIRPGQGVVLTSSTAATHDTSDMLRRYPKGLLATPLQVRDASFEFRYGSGASVDVTAGATGSVDTSVSLGGFTSLIEHRNMTLGFVLLALAIAMFWGSVHALSPGHGKSLVAAYLVGSRGTARHAVLLGATVTITHTAGVFALGLVALYLSHYIVPETLYPWLAVISGLTVVSVGATILTRRLSSGRKPDHEHLHHDEPGGHTHLPASEDGAITVRSLLALGVSGGLLPCPSALVVMLGAIALHRTAFGLVLVIAFSLGLACTLTGVGLLVLYARRFLDRVPSSRPLFRLLPVVSAGLVTALGGVLTVRGLDTFPSGAPTVLRAGLAAGAVLLVAAIAHAVTVGRRGRGHDHVHHHHDHPHHDHDHDHGHNHAHPELTHGSAAEIGVARAAEPAGEQVVVAVGGLGHHLDRSLQLEPVEVIAEDRVLEPDLAP
jgi:nickel/cobalt transporter (NicO) family protein